MDQGRKNRINRTIKNLGDQMLFDIAETTVGDPGEEAEVMFDCAMAELKIRLKKAEYKRYEKELYEFK